MINGVRFPVGPGDCYVLFPGDKVAHSSSAVNPRQGYACALRGQDISRAFEVAGFTSKKPFAPPEVFQKVEKACILLKETNAQVSSVAAAVGLDPRNFARIFKQVTGKTPRQYKKEC